MEFTTSKPPTPGLSGMHCKDTNRGTGTEKRLGGGKYTNSPTPKTAATQRKTRLNKSQGHLDKMDSPADNLVNREDIREIISKIEKFDTVVTTSLRQVKKVSREIRESGIITLKTYRKMHIKLKNEIKPLKPTNKKNLKFHLDDLDFFNKNIRVHLEKLLKGIESYMDNPFSEHDDINSDGYYLRQFIDTIWFQLFCQGTVFSDIEIVLRLYEYIQTVNTICRTILCGALCKKSPCPSEILKIIGLKIEYTPYTDEASDKSPHQPENGCRFTKTLVSQLIFPEYEIINPYLFNIHDAFFKFSVFNLDIYFTPPGIACTALTEYIRNIGSQAVIEIMAGRGYLAQSLIDNDMPVCACDTGGHPYTFTFVTNMDATKFIELHGTTSTATLRQHTLLIASPPPLVDICQDEKQTCKNPPLPTFMDIKKYLTSLLQKWEKYKGGPVIIFSECIDENELYDVKKLEEAGICIQPLAPFPKELTDNLRHESGTAKAFQLTRITTNKATEDPEYIPQYLLEWLRAPQPKTQPMMNFSNSLLTSICAKIKKENITICDKISSRECNDKDLINGKKRALKTTTDAKNKVVEQQNFTHPRLKCMIDLLAKRPDFNKILCTPPPLISEEVFLQLCNISVKTKIATNFTIALMTYKQLYKEPTITPLLLNIKHKSKDFYAIAIFHGQSCPMSSSRELSRNHLRAFGLNIHIIDPWLGFSCRADNYAHSVKMTVERLNTTQHKLLVFDGRKHETTEIPDFMEKPESIQIIHVPTLWSEYAPLLH